MLPLNNLIAVRPIKQAEKKTEAGLILSGTKEPVEKATVLQLSPEVQERVSLLKLPLEAGAIVLYPVGAGTKVNNGTEEILLIDYSRLIAII